MSFRDLDAIGIMSTDLQILETTAEHLLDINHLTESFFTDEKPPTFLYSAHLFPVEDHHAQNIYDKVAAALEKTLGIERKVVDFNEEWKKRQTYTEEEFEDYFSPVSANMDF
jgi:hypothetical protein